MRSVKVFVLSAAILLLLAFVIHLFLNKTSIGDEQLQNTKQLLELEDKKIAQEFEKYVECEVNGADVIECIRNYGKESIIKVGFYDTSDVIIYKQISDVSKVLDPMNQVNVGTGNFNQEINDDDSEVWIDSVVKYSAEYEYLGTSIIGLKFTPLEKPNYEYSGIVLFKYYDDIEQLCENFELLDYLESALNTQLCSMLGDSTSLEYWQEPFRKRIEPLYYNYSDIYFYYGANIDNAWDNLTRNEREVRLADPTNKQVLKFARPDWDGSYIQNIYDTKLVDMQKLAKPIKVEEASGIGLGQPGYEYEIDTRFSDGPMMVIHSSITYPYNLDVISNNKSSWDEKFYVNDGNYFKLADGTQYKFSEYDEYLKQIRNHFSQEYPKQIQMELNEALFKLYNTNIKWNKWRIADRGALNSAKGHFKEARRLIGEYYRSYISCSTACDELRKKADIPSCVSDLNTRSALAQSYTGNKTSVLLEIQKESDEIITIDQKLGEIMNNNTLTEPNFFGNNTNGYLRTALVVMNSSTDISSLLSIASADNDYKDYIDNSIREIDTLLQREVN